MIITRRSLLQAASFLVAAPSSYCRPSRGLLRPGETLVRRLRSARSGDEIWVGCDAPLIPYPMERMWAKKELPEEGLS